MIIATGWPPEATVALVVAALSTLGGVVTWWANGVRAERTRLKQLYAEAFAAIAAHQQFPYIIHRRRAPYPGHEEIGNEERLRISNALHTVQEAFNNYRAQISMESKAVSEKYETLIREERRIAGGYMREAWKVPPLGNDADFPIPLNFDELEEPKRAYLEAVRADLRFLRVAFPSLRSG